MRPSNHAPRIVMMDVNTGVGRGWSGKKVSVSSYGKGRRILLTIFAPVNYAGGCKWVGVSLSARQAIAVAYRLLHPLKPQFVAYANPAPLPADQGEVREMWDVLKVKHSNQVHDSYLAIGINKISIATRGAAGKKDYFRGEHTEELSNSEIKRLCGILYYWAGAQMIGCIKRKKVIIETVIGI